MIIVVPKTEKKEFDFEEFKSYLADHKIVCRDGKTLTFWNFAYLQLRDNPKDISATIEKICSMFPNIYWHMVSAVMHEECD